MAKSKTEKQQPSLKHNIKNSAVRSTNCNKAIKDSKTSIIKNSGTGPGEKKK